MIEYDQLKSVFTVDNHEYILMDGADMKSIVGIRSW